MASKPKQDEKLNGNNLMIVLALVTFLAVGITGLAVKFMVASIQLDAKVIGKKTTSDKNLSTDLVNAPKLVDAYNALDAKAGVLADALPVTSDYPSLLVEMENISNTAGLKLKTVTPDLNDAASLATASAGAGTSVDGSAPQTFAFSITYDGSYDALIRLLGSLETSARPIRVIGMQSTGSGSALSGQLDLETYFMDKATLPIGTEEVK